MTSPLLLVFATRYDDVTRRTYSIAQRLLTCVGNSGVACGALLESSATAVDFLEAAAKGPAVIAFYCHGDSAGRILDQNREPCWTIRGAPDLSGVAVVTHACRAVSWLREQAACTRARLLVGYEDDLITPADGSDRFWEIYEGVHCFVAQHLAMGADNDWIRREFYSLCTKCIHELNASQAGLVEIIAVQQSRDEVVFV